MEGLGECGPQDGWVEDELNEAAERCEEYFAIVGVRLAIWGQEREGLF